MSSTLRQPFFVSEALHRGLKRHKVGYLTFLAFRTEPKFEMLQMAMFQNAEEI